MQRILITILLMGLSAGCASSRAMVTGKPRASVRARDVELLKTTPAAFETINAATHALQRRAGSISANAVILDNPENNGIVFVSGFLDRHVRISGKAVFVNEANATAP